jgi:hypothetical protein
MLFGPLGDLIVHHVNEDKLDNRAFNLQRATESWHNSHYRKGDDNPMRNMTVEQHAKRVENWRKSRVKTETSECVDNHIIVAIENCPEEDVYDFTVPDTHTALVGSGIVAHNCNTHCYFSVRKTPDDKTILDLTVNNRSNDLIYGCLGSNVFHFGFLLELMASLLGFELGTYYQIPNNLHIYIENPTAQKCLNNIKTLQGEVLQYEEKDKLTTFPMVTNTDSWFTELEFFMRTGVVDDFFQNPFFESVAYPMLCAHKAHKSVTVTDLHSARARYHLAMPLINECQDEQLQKACMDWLGRRLEAAEARYG